MLRTALRSQSNFGGGHGFPGGWAAGPPDVIASFASRQSATHCMQICGPCRAGGAAAVAPAPEGSGVFPISFSDSDVREFANGTGTGFRGSKSRA